MRNMRDKGEKEPFIMPSRKLLMSLFSKNVSYSSFKVLLCLMTHSNRRTGNCFPSAKTIAKETCVSESSVFRAIKELKENGFIDYDSGGFRGGKNWANDYRINDPNFHAFLFEKPTGPENGTATKTPEEGDDYDLPF